MPECRFYRSCLYFAELFRARPAFARLYQGKYCLARSEDCTRYQTKQRIAPKPADPKPGRSSGPDRTLVQTP